MSTVGVAVGSSVAAVVAVGSVVAVAAVVGVSVGVSVAGVAVGGASTVAVGVEVAATKLTDTASDTPIKVPSVCAKDSSISWAPSASELMLTVPDML